MSNYYRPTRADIDLDKISGNYRTLSHSVPDKTIIPVVKADAYGHGAKKVCEHLYHYHKVRFFAVSTIEEALDLKTLGLTIDILIMGPIIPEDLSVVSKNQFIFTLTNETVFEAMKTAHIPLRFQIKIDTGMHRLGFSELNTVKSILNVAVEQDSLMLEGLYTHFATSDSDAAYLQKQKRRFESILSALPYLPKMIHASNSSAIFKYEADMPYTTHARAGISLYGYSLDGRRYGLEPVMVFKTKILDIRTLEPGEFLGYGISYKAKDYEKIGILPVGYADGWIRKNQNGMVRIQGNPYSIVGRVCMDMTFVKIDDTITLYDDVVLFGVETLDADHVAHRLNTISYEVLCMVGKRVPRLYKIDRT